MIKAIIIEDEPDLRELNRRLIQSNFNDIEIVGETDSVEGGIELIRNKKPQLVLMDIEIKGGTAFNILQKVKPYSFKLVIITAYNKYAIKAIKFSAIDYILKPINELEFVAAIENALQLMMSNQIEQQMVNLINLYEKRNQPKKIVLRTKEAISIVDISDIEYCKSDNSYTTFFLKDDKKVIVSKSIKDFSEILEEHNFFRPHQSYLVNLNSVSKIDKADGGFILMKNGREIPISSRRKQIVFEMVNRIHP